MKIYVAGKITGLDNYKEFFEAAADQLKSQGHNVMNPATLPDGFEYEEYMKICFSMIDVCNGIYLLNNWKESSGARREHEYAMQQGKKLIFESEVI